MRAGLALVAAVSDLKTHAALQTRVGIATGLVVVGDLIGSGASQEQAIVGETPNLAAGPGAIRQSAGGAGGKNSNCLLRCGGGGARGERLVRETVSTLRSDAHRSRQRLARL